MNARTKSADIEAKPRLFFAARKRFVLRDPDRLLRPVEVGPGHGHHELHHYKGGTWLVASYFNGRGLPIDEWHDRCRSKKAVIKESNGSGPLKDYFDD